MSFVPLTQDCDSRRRPWDVDGKGYWFALGYFAGSIVSLLFVLALRALHSITR
jgi:hypothetical protein